MIHWFPGHMNKALRELASYTKLVDSIVYVLDARAPRSSINEEFEKFITNKPTVFVLNKADLISKDFQIKWEQYFLQKEKECVCVNSLLSKGTYPLKEALSSLHEKIVEKYLEKGINRVPRSMVIGIPNTGKSTLINNLANKKKLLTADKPGVTRKIQWVRIPPNVDIMDSPGVLYPNFSDQEKAYKLAAIGSIKDVVYEEMKVAEFLIGKIQQIAPNKFIERYQLSSLGSDISNIFEEISRNRGYLLSGGEFDKERAAISVINDFRKGKLGKICLDDI